MAKSKNSSTSKRSSTKKAAAPAAKVEEENKVEAPAGEQEENKAPAEGTDLATNVGSDAPAAEENKEEAPAAEVKAEEPAPEPEAAAAEPATEEEAEEEAPAKEAGPAAVSAADVDCCVDTICKHKRWNAQIREALHVMISETVDMRARGLAQGRLFHGIIAALTTCEEDEVKSILDAILNTINDNYDAGFTEIRRFAGINFMTAITKKQVQEYMMIIRILVETRSPETRKVDARSLNWDAVEIAFTGPYRVALVERLQNYYGIK